MREPADFVAGSFFPFVVVEMLDAVYLGDMRPPQQAILFDFWQTLVEDSRERLALNKRMAIVAEFLNQHDVATPDNLIEAFKAGSARFFEVYHDEQRTATLLERLQWIFEFLGLEYSDDELSALVPEVAKAGLLLNPQPTEHLSEVLEELGKNYQLGIVSDTGFTPGWVLREHLERHGLLKHFSTFSFSDETGHGKPHPRTFLTALEALQVAPENAIHCGDLPDHDINGANALGITSVLYTGLHYDEVDGIKPSYVINDWRELPAIAREVFG